MLGALDNGLGGIDRGQHCVLVDFIAGCELFESFVRRYDAIGTLYHRGEGVPHLVRGRVNETLKLSFRFMGSCRVSGLQLFTPFLLRDLCYASYNL